MTFDENDRLRVRENVFAREFDGEIVLLDLGGGVYYGLDAIATEVWKGIASGRTLKDIVPALVASYEVDEHRLMNDLVGLASEWLDKKLVERVT
jgi:hypothetical protein